MRKKKKGNVKKEEEGMREIENETEQRKRKFKILKFTLNRNSYVTEGTILLKLLPLLFGLQIPTPATTTGGLASVATKAQE